MINRSKVNSDIGMHSSSTAQRLTSHLNHKLITISQWIKRSCNDRNPAINPSMARGDQRQWKLACQICISCNRNCNCNYNWLITGVIRICIRLSSISTRINTNTLFRSVTGKMCVFPRLYRKRVSVFSFPSIYSDFCDS